ncbi:MAG: hypothetical protein ABRQ27_16155 [Clostridiaceae bacterium]
MLVLDTKIQAARTNEKQYWYTACRNTPINISLVVVCKNSALYPGFGHN